MGLESKSGQDFSICLRKWKTQLLTSGDKGNTTCATWRPNTKIHTRTHTHTHANIQTHAIKYYVALRFPARCVLCLWLLQVRDRQHANFMIIHVHGVVWKIITCTAEHRNPNWRDVSWNHLLSIKIWLTTVNIRSLLVVLCVRCGCPCHDRKVIIPSSC